VTEAGSGTALLLVDDRRENLEALRAILEPLGHPLLLAGTGEEALRHLLVSEVGLILLDVRMPGMDGLEVAARIKERERTADIPIIFLTAHPTDEAGVLEAFSSGAVDYLTKPVDPRLLQAKVAVFTELSEKSRALKRQSELLARKLDELLAAEARNLRRLAEAALVINSTSSLDEMLSVITATAREVTLAHEAEVRVGQGRELQSSRSFSTRYEWWASEGHQFDVSPLFDLVLEREGPVRMTRKEVQATLSTRGLHHVTSGHPMLEGWLAVPLLGRTRRRLGLIQVADKDNADFTESDEVVLLQLAQLAAVAIENAERYAQEHDIAETLQRSLLPDALPEVPGLELCARYQPGGPGSQVGGDWYDVFVLDDSRVALAVGDVAGRGPRAAAVMGQLRTAMRAYALQGLAPGDVLARLDRLLHILAPTAMATAAYLVLDAPSGRLEWASAGHPPPLLVTAAGSSFLECDPNAPLGTVVDRPFVAREVQLKPGSLLLCYTDGLIEEPRSSLDDGLRRLAESVDPELGELPELCDAVLKAMVPAEGADDVALLAARLAG
jgi:serine phosphatase RsbU (regulator of sigma subunit)/DNA-binding response OmpR family regulator